MKHILAAVDGSEPSKKAGQFAADLARQTGAALTVLLVIEPPSAIPIAPFDAYALSRAGPSSDMIGAARGLLESLKHELPAGRVQNIVEVGRAPTTILEQAEKLGADHIVVGARGHGAGTRWLLGSTSDRVVHHAHCPVTVVR